MRRIVALAALLCTFWTPSIAEEKETGWFDTAELSYVATGGNSETSTLGFKNVLTRKWDRSALTITAAGVHANATTFTRTATGTDPSNFVVVESEDSETTAETYLFDARYDRELSESFFWFAGLKWDRNRPAGTQNRYAAVGGVGNTWRDDDKIKFRTDYALTYTDQEDVVEVPGASDSFVGLRGSWTYEHKFGENTTYVNEFAVDENLDETSDFRLEMLNSVAVSINSHLALKAGLRLVFDNEPAFEQLALIGSIPPGQTVFVELDDLDSVFTTSMVVNF